MNTCYFSELCPDTEAFLTTLHEIGVDYEAVNITENMTNLKRFLHLRDHEPAFTEKKQKTLIGIPVLHCDDGELLFTPHSIEQKWGLHTDE